MPADVAEELPPRAGDATELSRDQRRACRRREVRSRTESMKRLTKRELEIGRALYPEPVTGRPRTRGDCDRVERPCPYAGCRYNLFLDVDPLRGSIKFNFPDLEPDQLIESCALDVAEAGGESLEIVGELLNVTRERLRQVEIKALAKLLPAAPQLELDPDEKRTPCRAHHHESDDDSADEGTDFNLDFDEQLIPPLALTRRGGR